MPFFVIPEHERKDRAPVDASDSPSSDDLEDELQVSASCTVNMIDSQNSTLAGVGTIFRERFAYRIHP
jgi:hypothetical protein